MMYELDPEEIEAKYYKKENIPTCYKMMEPESNNLDNAEFKRNISSMSPEHQSLNISQIRYKNHQNGLFEEEKTIGDFDRIHHTFRNENFPIDG